MQRIFGAALLTMASVVSAAAQHYPILPVAGSPNAAIFTMMQDSRSALWLGTIDDVYVFDGRQFHSLRPYGFPREYPNSFAEDADGGIWIATQGPDVFGGNGVGGVYRYQAGQVVKILSGDSLSVLAVAPGLVLASMSKERDGGPAYGDLYLFRKVQGNWTSDLLLHRQANHLTLDHQGNALFPCPGGWCEANRQQLVGWHGGADQLSVRRHPASDLAERVLRDKFGCVWIRSEQFASYQCPGDAEPHMLPASDTSAHLEETDDGSIFTLAPMTLGRPGHFSVAIEREGVPDMGGAIVGKDGTIWIGGTKGLYQFRHPWQIVSWNNKDGVQEPISIAASGSSLFATDLSGLLRWNGQGWDRLALPEKDTGPIAAGPPGTVLMEGQTGKLMQLNRDGHLMAQIPIQKRQTDLNFDDRFVGSPDGVAWLGYKGLQEVTVVHGEIRMVSQNLPDSVSAIHYDKPSDTLWVCDGGDIYFRRRGTWGRITQQDGLLNRPCHSIAVASNGDAWIGYKEQSVGQIQNAASGHPVVQNYSYDSDLIAANGAVHFLGTDAHDRLWRGYDVLYLSSQEAATKGQWLRMGPEEGIEPTTAADRNVFQPIFDGPVFFGTSDGIMEVHLPDDFLTRFPAPPVFIGGLTIGDASEVYADTVGPIPSTSNVIAHIGTLQFDRRSALRFRYRVLPEQKGWKDATSYDLALGKLGWGRHTLQVQGRMLTGPWSPVAEQALTVPWPFWLTWPGLLAIGASGTGLGFGTRQWMRHRKYLRGLAFPDMAAWRMDAMSPAVEQLIGTVIAGRYEIGHILAIGGFSTVTRARDLREGGQLRAVKIFREDSADAAWLRHRFEHEVAALQEVSHPNIVRITDHGTMASGVPYLVMEFIHGRSLREILDAGALAKPQVARFLRQIADALAVLHEAAIYHRDLKPENLMVRADDDGLEQIVLIDFSIALVKVPDKTFHGISRVAGTLGYMAPEQVTGYADSSTDIHSLAKVLIEMLTGARCVDLFPEASLDLSQKAIEYFQNHSGLLQEEAVLLVSSALRFDPRQRPHDVHEFAAPIVEDLERTA